MRQMFPESDDGKDTSVRDEGTNCHELAASILLGTEAPDLPYTEDAKQVAAFYAETVQKHATIINVEARVDISSIHPDCFGTVDAWLLEDDHLYIYDLKYGFGWVDAFENWQMLCYAAGLVDETVNKVTMTIVQPRAYGPDGPVKSWTATVEELEPYWVQLRNAASIVGDCKTGSHCRYCSAKLQCVAFRHAGPQLLEAVSQISGGELSTEALATQLAIVKRALEHLTFTDAALSGAAEAIIKSGKILPGWDLVSKPGALAWDAGDDEVKALGELAGVDTMKLTPITPTQAIKAGVPESLVKSAASRKAGSAKLKPINPKRIFA